MNQSNVDLETLTEVMRAFCYGWRDFVLGSSDYAETVLQDRAIQLQTHLKQFFPSLSFSWLNDTPDIVGSKRVIFYAVQGINDKSVLDIWESFFIGAKTIRSMAFDLGYSDRHIKRLISSFPKRVIIQLYEKHQEIVSPMNGVSSTLHQERKSILQKKLGITGRQSEILLEFLTDEKAGRRNIADRLCISYATLKKHIQLILKRTKTKTLNETVDRARAILSEVP